MRIVTFFSSVPFHATYTGKLEVAPSNLRQLYNDGQYYWRATVVLPPATKPEFETECVYEADASEAVDQPPGTLSQIMVYHVKRAFFVRVHQLMLPDSETDEWERPLLGGPRGEPDPKDLIEDETWYTLIPEKVPKFIRRKRYEEG